MGALIQDLRYGLRTLAKSPGFTAIAILTLALGIGANTAIFSVVKATLLAPLPFKDAGQLVNLYGHASFFSFWNLGLSLPDVNDIRAQSKSFSAIVPFEYAMMDLTGGGAPRQLDAVRVPPDVFATLGLKPRYGRTISPSEMEIGQEHEAILSGRLWRIEFGSDPGIVGKSITLDGKAYRVVGVMPEIPQIIFSPAAADVWVPLALTPAELASRGMHGTPTLARLKPGVTMRQAQAELNTIAAGLEKAYPKDDRGWGFRVDSLRSDLNRNTETPLAILLGAVGLVLLIVCANVGNLFLSRGWARRRELAIRSTLGATHGRLVRQLLTESTLLALVGGAAGLLVASWGANALGSLLPPAMRGSEEIRINAAVLWFALGVSILAGVLFGLAPAVVSSRPELSGAMKEGGGSLSGGSGAKQSRLRQSLGVMEVALALTLVIGATLALRSFSNLLRVNVGFETERVLDMRVDFPQTKFKTTEGMFAYLRSLVERLGATPGVESVSLVGNAPLTGAHGEGEFTIKGVQENPNAPMTGEVAAVGPRYFGTMGIPVLRGREFSNEDVGKAAQVMIVNRAFVREYFGGQDPIGKRIFMGDEDERHHRIWDEVIGEVGDVHDRNPRIAAAPEIYTPYYGLTFTAGMFPGADMLLRIRANPPAVISAAQSALWAMDRNQPVSSVGTLEKRLEESVAAPRFQSFLLGVFGALGLVLAVVGIYGVISYSVTQRTHEIGIRMALGAEPGQVMKLVLRQGMWLAVTGVGIGLIASLMLTRLMRTLLFGVSATDPVTFAGVAILLILVALAACYIPARRAMRMDPMVALRYE